MKSLHIIFSSLLLCSSLSIAGLSQSESPYNSGGNQYGGEYLSTPPTSSLSSAGSFNNSVDSLGANTKTPYGSSAISQASDTGSSFGSSQSSYPSAPTSSGVATYNTEARTTPGAFERMGQWVKRKTHRPTGQPELDLANQRIDAGKARIKAVKARQKLEKHIVDSNAETEKLRRELQRAEEQASLLENQVKFQEANAGDSMSQDLAY